MTIEIETRKEPGQQRSRATLQSIFDASEKLISEYGFDVVSMTQIAKVAGMSKASLYRYFPNKQSLLMAHAERSFRKHRKEMQSLMEREESPEKMLRDSIYHYCEQHATNPFLLNLRAAIHADPVLSELDLNDSRENAALLAKYLNTHFPSLKKEEADARSLLTVELIDALARLVARVEENERSILIDNFVSLFFTDLNEEH